jgi:hypothetical protein
VVDGGLANIVAAIDSAEGYHDQTVADIRAIDGITNLWFLRVVRYKPEIPNNASGYVTEAELSKSDSPRAYPGRQEESPGYNPWG